MTSRTLGGVGVARLVGDTTGETSPPVPAVGDFAGMTLARRYDVLHLLGSGGMGAVYRAHDRELDDIVALKVIRSDLARERGAIEQFRHEVKLARRVTHVNIARTFELGVDGDLMFCTMELIEGESLRERLTREGALGIAEAAAIAVALCEGLAVAHAAGVIHRDIKPENVLLTPAHRVVLADFGVAAWSASDSDGALVGTLEYMAPEQARGEAATPATDVYAVGVVLFEMLCGLRAFAGSISEVLVAKQDVEYVALEIAEAVARQPLPAELAELVARATARDPARRISTAADLARALAPWLVAAPAAAPGSADPEAPELTLPTLVVLAPRALDEHAALHVAEGIHQETLRRLAGKRLRVWPRVEAFEMPGATFVELVAGRVLEVTLRRDELSTTLELPLAIEDVALAADAIAVAASELANREPATDAAERLELLLRARAAAHRGFRGIAPAMALFQEGNRRWPDDPRIACGLADMIVRHVQVSPQGMSFHEVGPLVEAALARAPGLAEAHVTAGQLALHTGDPVVAAREFRIAIACSPYAAEPHEGLGRMLLEAGFLDAAMARLEHALAIAPKLNSVRWEIARAHALEQNWLAHEQLIAELVRDGDLPMARLRFAVWRGDRAQVAECYALWKQHPSAFEPALFERVFSVFVDGTWERDRDLILTACLESRSPSKRRRVILAQIAAELTAYLGEYDLSLRLLEHAVDLDLFDRHWLERCVLFDPIRALPAGQRLLHRVRVRAESILDALYGDREERLSSSATLIVP